MQDKQDEIIRRLIEDARKQAWQEAMNFAMKCCAHGYTNSMLRTVFHNKFVEKGGEGEKA